MNEKIVHLIERIDSYSNISKRSYYCCVVFFLCIVWLVMYVLNIYTPYIADDYCISPRIGESFSVAQCFHMAYNNYFNWGGGVLCSFLQYLFGSLGDKVFNYFNASVFIALILVIYYFAVGTFRNIRLSLLSFITFALVIFPPAFGQCFLWMDGSIPYMWMMVLGFSYLIPLRKQLDTTVPVISNRFLAIIFGFWGIICAWTNITISVTIVAIYLLKIVYCRRAFFWEICSTVGSTIGFMFFYFAPGNFVRASDGLQQHSNIIERFVAIFIHAFEWNCFLPLLLLPLVLLFIKKIKFTKPLLIFYIGFILIHFSMIGAPYYSDRVRIGPVIFCIILSTYALSQLHFDSSKSKLFYRIICVILLLSASQALLKAKFDIMYFYNDTIAREQYVLNEKSKGTIDIEVARSYIPVTKYCGAWGLDNLTENSSSWVNVAYSNYYNINSVSVRK